MPTTIKDAAQTYVGVTVIAFEKMTDAVKDATGDLDERFGDARKDLETRVEEARKDLDDRRTTLRTDVDGRIKTSKKVAKKNTKDLRAKVDPAAERFEARLPYQLARPLEAGRIATWDFIDAKAPKKAPAKKAAAADKAVAEA